MAKAKLNITESSIKKFSAGIARAINKKLTSPAVRGRLSKSLKPFFEEQVEKAIAGESISGNTVTCKAFKPNSGVAGALGIGIGGHELTDKLQNGWKDLLPKQGRDLNGTPSATVKISFAKETFGKATYSLDIEKFYDSKNNTYVIPSSGKRIQWMRQYIEGLEVLTHQYVKADDSNISDQLREKIEQNSRTGQGIMVRFKLEELTPFILDPQPDPFPRVLKAVKQKILSNKFAEEFQKILRKALKDV